MNVYSIGFWGAPNLGDEMLCLSVNQLINQNLLDVGDTHFVVSLNAEISKSYTKLNNVQFIDGMYPKPKYFKSIFERVKAIKNTSIITLGGGGVISDKYTSEAIPRYYMDIMLGIFLNKKILLIGIGVLPLKNKIFRKWTSFVVNNSDSIYLRDSESLDNLKGNIENLEIPNARIGPDLSFYLNVSCAEKKESKNKRVIINLRKSPYLNADNVRKLILLFKDFHIVFLCAEPADENFYQEFIAENTLSSFEVYIPESLNQCIELMSNVEYIFAERLHVIALAIKVNTKSYFLEYEGKVTHFLKNNCEKYNSCTIQAFNADNDITLDDFIRPDINTTRLESNINAIQNLINSPIQNKNKKPSTRLVALFIYIIGMFLGSIYSLLLLIKRKVFGRGPFSILGKKFGY